MEAVFFDDLNILLKSNGSLDLVLFTGDLVQKGDASEYQKRLDEWLQKMWDLFSQIKLAPLLLAVPGNDDSVSSLGIHTRVHCFSALVGPKKRFERRFGMTMNQKTPGKLVDQAFHNYLAWWRAAKFPKPEQLIHGLLPGDFSASIVKDSYSLDNLGSIAPFVTSEIRMPRKISNSIFANSTLYATVIHQIGSGNTKLAC